MRTRRLYACWYGGQIVAQLLGDPSLTDEQVRALACASHDRFPICDTPLELPGRRRAKIAHATVKRYEEIPF